MLMHNYQTGHHPVYRFIEKLLSEKDNFTFEEYIDGMNQYFESLEDGEIVIEMLAENGKNSIDR